MLAVLLAESGSNWSEWVIVAVLVCGPGLVTVAWINSVCGDVVLTAPTVQTPGTAVVRPLAGRGRDERQARREQVGHLDVRGGVGAVCCSA